MADSKRKVSGVTTVARQRYNAAMKKEARDNIGNQDYVQPSLIDWVTDHYPQGLVKKAE